MGVYYIEQWSIIICIYNYKNKLFFVFYFCVIDVGIDIKYRYNLYSITIL